MSDVLSILSVLWKVLFIAFFFGFCIFIHEFGHLLAAIWQKLHVETFSIGFGHRVWGFTHKGIQYAIGWLPFGGFVALPQLDPTDTPETSDKKPLEPAKPWPRAVTAFAGPFFNVLFGFLLATVMWGVGLYEAPPASSCSVTRVPRMLPVYGKELAITDTVLSLNGKQTDASLEELCAEWTPEQGSMTLSVQAGSGDKPRTVVMTPDPNPEWEAGLRAGDRIVALNGAAFTKGSTEFTNEYLLSGLPQITLDVIRDGKTIQLSYTAAANPMYEGLKAPFFTLQNPVAVDHVRPDSPAAKAGVRKGDQLLQLNDANIMSASSLGKMLDSAAGTSFTLLLSRNGTQFRTEPIAAGEHPTPNGLGLGFAVTVGTVIPGSPAEQAGIRPRDKIIGIDGREFSATSEMREYIRGTRGTPMTLSIDRDGTLLQFTVSTRPSGDDAVSSRVWLLGVTLESSAPKVIAHPTPWKQFATIFNQTKRTLGLLFAPMTSAVTSKITHKPRTQSTVKLQHMSGPLGIVMMLWYSLQADGLRGGFSLIILISFSLAIMNLLPIPVLDGGHILFALIEMLIRRRLPVRFLRYIQNVFAVLIIVLFVYISFFDGKRLMRFFRFGTTKPKPPAQTEAKP